MGSEVSKLNEHVKGIALAAYNKADYQTAFSLYETAANEGNDTEAMYNLGIMCATGRGTKQDYLKALEWFTKALGAGDTQSEKMLDKVSWDYFNSNLNSWTAEQAFEAAATITRIRYGSGDISKAKDLLEGIGGNLIQGHNDYPRGAKCFRAMAQYGDSDPAQFNMGLFCLNGQGVDENSLAALYWFGRSSIKGNVPAKEKRNWLMNEYIRQLDFPGAMGQMNILVRKCRDGADDIPKDSDSFTLWQSVLTKLTMLNQMGKMQGDFSSVLFG